MTAIIHNNIAPNCSNITGTNEDPDYPIGNILSNSPADKFHTTAMSTNIVLTFSQNVQFESIVLAAHNIPLGSNVKIYLSNDNFQNYDAYNFIVNPDVMYVQVPGNHLSIKIGIISSRNIEIGYLCLGSFCEISQDPRYPVQRIPVESSHILLSDIGQKNKVLGVMVWKIGLNFPSIPLTEYQLLCNIINRNKVLVLIVSTETKEAYQGIMELPKGDEELEGVYFSLEFEQNPYSYEVEEVES
jgi:hypothetical protein